MNYCYMLQEIIEIGNKWKLHAKWNPIQLHAIFIWNAVYVHMDLTNIILRKYVSHRKINILIYEV